MVKGVLHLAGDRFLFDDKDDAGGWFFDEYYKESEIETMVIDLYNSILWD
jgi:hypothetical protein